MTSIDLPENPILMGTRPARDLVKSLSAIDDSIKISIPYSTIVTNSYMTQLLITLYDKSPHREYNDFVENIVVDNKNPFNKDEIERSFKRFRDFQKNRKDGFKIDE